MICPMIDTRAQCEAFVRAVRYPPSGNRSFGPARGLLYGGGDYADSANGTILSWAMIETELALADVEEIATVPGLSGLYIGPNDLSMTLEGAIATPLSPRVVGAVKRIMSVAHANRLKLGIFCPDVPFAREMVSLGCDLPTVMNDAGLLRKATSALIEELRSPAPERASASP